MNARSLLTLIIAVAGLATLPVAQSFAQTDMGFKGIGGRLGFTDPESEYKGTYNFGVVADFGEIVSQLYGDASLSVWKSTLDFSAFNYYGDYYSEKLSLTDVALRAGAKYHFSEGAWTPFAGGGLGYHNYSFKYESDFGDAEIGLPHSDVGIYIVGGAEHQFTRNLIGQSELMLDFGDVDQTNFQFNLIYMLGE